MVRAVRVHEPELLQRRLEGRCEERDRDDGEDDHHEHRGEIAPDQAGLVRRDHTDALQAHAAASACVS